MTRPLVLSLMVAAGLTMASCKAEPRATSYFEGNPQEKAQVLSDCLAGTHRGEECNNAQSAQVKSRHKATAARYREGFK